MKLYSTHRQPNTKQRLERTPCRFMEILQCKVSPFPKLQPLTSSWLGLPRLWSSSSQIKRPPEFLFLSVLTVRNWLYVESQEDYWVRSYFLSHKDHSLMLLIPQSLKTSISLFCSVVCLWWEIRAGIWHCFLNSADIGFIPGWDYTMSIASMEFIWQLLSEIATWSNVL